MNTLHYPYGPYSSSSQFYDSLWPVVLDNLQLKATYCILHHKTKGFNLNGGRENTNQKQINSNETTINHMSSSFSEWLYNFEM